MAKTTDDPLRRGAERRASFLQHVQTSPLKDVPLSERAAGGGDGGSVRATARSDGSPTGLKPPSILRSEAPPRLPMVVEAKAAGQPALTLFVLLLVGAILGAVTGTIVANSVFP